MPYSGGMYPAEIFPPDIFPTGLFPRIVFSELSYSYKQLSNEESLTKLKKSYKDKQLTLILGAGVSLSCGLPSWDKLLEELLKKCFDLYAFSSTDIDGIVNYFTKKEKQPLILARYIQQYLEKKGKNNFEETVRNTLYDRLIEESDLIREICQLFNSLDSIITYNYDDILETYLRELKIQHKVIHNIGMLPKEGEVPIYHVHGFLARGKKLNSKNKIVFSEEIYHKYYLDTYSWNNITQINKFSEKTCLFIGTSLTDPNMRRLLDIALTQRKDKEKPHFIIRERPKYNEESDNSVKDLDNSILRFKEQDAYSLGINTLWVENNVDIPGKLREIRSP